MMHRQIVVKAILQAIDILDRHIDFKRMSGTAARHGTKRCVRLAAYRLDALDAPQHIGKLSDVHLFLRVDAMGASPVDDGQEVSLDFNAFKIDR